MTVWTLEGNKSRIGTVARKTNTHSHPKKLGLGLAEGLIL